MKKKILFWITLDFRSFLLATYFQKCEDFELYAIIDCPSNAKDFFKTQKIVNFKKFWFFHDQIDKSKNYSIDYLNETDKKYKLNLWELIVNERIFYRFNDFYNFDKNQILSIQNQTISFFENLLDTISPIVLVTKDPGFIHLEILTRMCKQKNILSLMPFTPKVTNRMMITDDPDTITTKINYNDCTVKGRDFSELQEYLENTDAKKNIDDYVTKFTTHSLMTKFKVLLKYLTSSTKSEQELYTYFGRKKFKVIFNYLILELKKIIRENYINKNLDSNPDLKKPYVYFALGVDMERNLLLGAPLLNNQIEIIRTIVKSLPINYSLYVKETPAQKNREWRKISEYQTIMNIPNVKLIHPNFSSKDLIKNSSLVISIIGSSPFEAAIYEKPSIVFAKTTYSVLPSVITMTDLTKLRKTIENSLLTEVRASDVDRFFDYIEKNSFQFNLDQFEVDVAIKFSNSALLIDTKIDENTMKEFIEENNTLINKLGDEYMKKIEQYDNSFNNNSN